MPRRDKANRLLNAPASPVGPYLAAFRIHATACVITFSAYAIAVGGKHFTLKRNDFSVVIGGQHYATTRTPALLLFLRFHMDYITAHIGRGFRIGLTKRFLDGGHVGFGPRR